MLRYYMYPHSVRDIFLKTSRVMYAQPLFALSLLCFLPLALLLSLSLAWLSQGVRRPNPLLPFTPSFGPA